MLQTLAMSSRTNFMFFPRSTGCGLDFIRWLIRTARTLRKESSQQSSMEPPMMISLSSKMRTLAHDKGHIRKHRKRFFPLSFR
jgi:hypothetical protein